MPTDNGTYARLERAVEQIRQLHELQLQEGRRLAVEVLEGRLTIANLEHGAREFRDIEPQIGLALLSLMARDR